MANLTFERGACQAPFLQLSNFHSDLGYLPGRFCAPVPTLEGTVDCCLPCPVTDWVYSDDFNVIPRTANWLNVAGMVCTISLLITFLILPVKITNRHYLTVGLVAAVCLLQLGFIIPLGADPEQCHDSITPNDMHSDLTCAFSGAFLLFGGFAAIMWGFLRSLSIHLQICWQVVTGKKFFWSSMIVGWGVPALFIAIALPLTGTSYRFGNTCHINHEKALEDYWGPLLAFAALSTLLQFSTFGYCIRVYIKSLVDDGSTHNTSQPSSSELPSFNGSVKTVTAGQAYRRIKKVIAIQWRGTVIVLIIIINVVFLAVVFVQMDNTVTSALQNLNRAEPWLICLVLNNGDKSACLDKVANAHLVTNEPTVMAVLILLSLNGIWTLLFLGRTSMLLGWIDLIRRSFGGADRKDFVSVDAKRFSAISTTNSASTHGYNAKHYEMIVASPASRPPSMPISMTSSVPLKSPETKTAIISSPYDRDGLSPLPQSPQSPSSLYRESDYFGKIPQSGVSTVAGDVASPNPEFSKINAEHQYRSPKLSFSTPRPPSAAGRTDSLSTRPYSLQWRDSTRDQVFGQQQQQQQQRTFSPPPPAATSTSTSTAGGTGLGLGMKMTDSNRPYSPSPSASASLAQGTGTIRPDSRQSRQSRQSMRSSSPAAAAMSFDWDPASTHAKPMDFGTATRRADGLGKIIGKDEGF